MRYVLALLAVAGVIVSSLALHAHYTFTTLPCDINSHWDCGLVNHSRYSLWHGIPVAILGIVGYAVIGILAMMRQRWVVLVLSLLALGFALRLSYIEDRVLEVWCVYCVSSQVIIAIVTLLALAWVFAGGRKKFVGTI